MKLIFGDLLGLELGVSCTVLTPSGTSTAQSALLVLSAGAQADGETLVERLKQSFHLVQPPGSLRVLFGYSILTAPFPLLVGALMTEHNTLFDKLSLFGWVEDNAILEPRAEVFGLTPFGEQPVLFLRDLDLNRPVEAWIATEQPTRWLRVAGILIEDNTHQGAATAYLPDQAALAALALILPADAQALVSGLRQEVAAGQPLRVALRRRRRQTDAPLMQLCDGWRVLAQAARFAQVAGAEPHTGAAEDLITEIVGVLQIDAPRKW